VIFQYPGIGDSKSVKQARDLDIPEIWKHSPGINPYPGNGGNTSSSVSPYIIFFRKPNPQSHAAFLRNLLLRTHQVLIISQQKQIEEKI